MKNETTALWAGILWIFIAFVSPIFGARYEFILMCFVLSGVWLAARLIIQEIRNHRND
jgi:hypothetical protein